MTRSLALLFVFACSHASKPSAPAPTGNGTLSGTVHFVGTPCMQPGPGCDGPLTDYEVVVLSSDGKTAVAKTKTDAAGMYTLTLPAGAYTIQTQAGLHPENQRRNDVTVTTGNSATLDLTIDTGVR